MSNRSEVIRKLVHEMNPEPEHYQPDCPRYSLVRTVEFKMPYSEEEKRAGKLDIREKYVVVRTVGFQDEEVASLEFNETGLVAAHVKYNVPFSHVPDVLRPVAR